MRNLSRALGDGVASPSRIHDAFTKPRLPDWELLDVIVEALARKIPRADPTAEVERFHALWDAASDDPPAPVGSPPAGAEPNIPPPPPLMVVPPAIPPPLENEREDSGPVARADAEAEQLLADAEALLHKSPSAREREMKALKASLARLKAQADELESRGDFDGAMDIRLEEMPLLEALLATAALAEDLFEQRRVRGSRFVESLWPNGPQGV
ncbi:hypothetical protein [Streptomyces sp. NPDC003943]